MSRRAVFGISPSRDVPSHPAHTYIHAYGLAVILVWGLVPFAAPISTFKVHLVESFLILKNLLS